MKLRIFPAILVVAASLFISHAAAEGCTITVSPTTADVPGAVFGAGEGATVCFDPGTYSLSEPIVPRNGQVLSGAWIGGPRSKLVSTAAYVINGLGASDVSYSQLGLIGSTSRALWLGDRATAYRVWSKDAGDFGLAAYGDSIAISYAKVVGAAETGIIGSDHVGLTISNSIVRNGNEDCAFSSNLNAGGIKISNEDSVLLSANTVSANGGHQIWLDEGATNVVVSGNTTRNALACPEGDGIRYEISCSGTIEGNVVDSNPEGVDVTSSSSVSVSSNTISNSSAFAIRFLSDGRTPSCGSVGGGTASTNSISRGAGSYVDHADGATFSGNLYAGDCSGSYWVGLSFAAWQGIGQDTEGTCGGIATLDV